MNNNISFIQPKDAWDALSIPEKAEMMKVAVSHGIYNLNDIRQKYNEFAMGGDTEEASVSPNEATRMGAMVGAAIASRPKSYIGGSTSEAREKYWKTDNEMRMLTDSVANQYGISPDLLRTRMDNEGYTDARINEINKDVQAGTNRALIGIALFNSEAMPYVAGSEFGLDDVADYINNGTVNLINENWGDGQFRNEQGRWTHMAMGHNYSDNVGIMAATLKALKDIARKDFPNASDADLDRYASAYYNRGIEGGRKWVKRGAKGYKVNKHSDGGTLVNLFYEGGDENPMNYEYKGTVYDDELKKQGITHIAELPEIVVTGRDPKGYRSAFDGSVQPYFEYFGALGHGLQPLSLSQHVGAAADAIQGKRNYFDSLFNGNSGFFTDKYAEEHPIVSTLGNMAGDITLPLATMYGTKSLINAVKTTPKLAMQEESLIKDLFAGISDYGKTTGVKAMSIADRKKGYQKMIDFISSPEYQSRLENAGLGDYKDYMINLIEKRLNGKNNFPAWRADVIKGRKSIRGLSEVDPFDIDYGVTVRSDLQGDDFLRTFDHELAHWSTKNTFPNFFYDVYQSFVNRTLPNIKLQKLMKANDRVAPTKTWKDYRMEQTEGMSKEEIKRYKELFRDLKKRFKYVSDPQERRARAYSMLQEAKRRGISTDELVDMYTIDGHIYGEAPDQLFDLGMSYTPENLKKYLKGFMGIATPFALTTNLTKNEQEQ